MSTLATAEAAAPPLPVIPADTAAARRAAQTKRLLEDRIGPTLARLAAPNVIAMFTMSLTSIAEAYFAGLLGVTALAGLALVYPLVMLVQMLAAGALGGAISAAVARSLGHGDPARSSGLAIAAWLIATAAAAATAVLFALFGRTVFGWLGGGGDAMTAALSYAVVFFPGSVAIWLCHAGLSVVRGTGNMLTPSLILFVVSLGSIPLSGALSLGWGPFPALGMAGLATGIIASYVLGALAGGAYVLAGRAGLAFRGALRRLGRAQFADILRVALVASINTLQTVLTIVIMVGIVGRHGPHALAGYGLGARLEFLMIPVIFGIGAAMTSMVGANIGAGRPDRALRIAWTGGLAAAAIVGAIGAALAVFPDLWLRISLDPSAVGALAAGRAYFHIVGPFYACFAFGLAFYFASQGAGRMIWPVGASLARMLVAFAGALALTAATAMGIDAVFAAIAAGMAVYATVTMIAMKRARWG